MPHDEHSPIAAIMLKLGKKKDGEPGAGPPEGGDDGDGAHGLHMAAQQLIHAIHAGDEVAVVHAFSAMFDMLESMPHEEAGDGEGGGEPPPPPGGEE